MDIGVLGGFISGAFVLVLSVLCFFVWSPWLHLEDEDDEIDRLLTEDANRVPS